MSAILLLLLLTLSACGGSQDDSSLILTDDNPGERQTLESKPIALAYVIRCTAAINDAIDSVTFCAGGDLFYRSSLLASAEEINLTEAETQGEGDVQSVNVSFDGSALILSLRRPQDTTFNIWHYDIDTAALSPILINDDGNDIDPAFLPNGRIVFSSDRQQRSQLLLAHQGQEPYQYVDEYRRNPATVLHTMNNDGSDVQQISFNLSHDRFPTVRSDGKIIFSRWSHLGNKSRYDLYGINPDGTGLFIEYGAFSEGNSHLAPREMEDGRLLCTVLPLGGTLQGGAVMIIDNHHFDEQSKPNGRALTEGAIEQELRDQYQPTESLIPLADTFSTAGRFANAYPLWDGSHRFIASYRYTQKVNIANPFTTIIENQEIPTRYQLVMVDTTTKTMQTLVLAEGENSVFGAVIIRPRTIPSTYPVPSTPEQIRNTGNQLTLELTANEIPTGILNILSVYDSDNGYLARMDASVFASNLGETLDTISPTEPNDLRDAIADISTLKDPRQSTANDRPARYFRITKGIPMPSGIAQKTLGETDYEMRQIVGYGPVHPDGSIRAEIPADTPITIEVLDKEGRSFAPHLSWLQVRPGETRTCHGCHSPRTAPSINTESLKSAHPNTYFSPQQVVTATGTINETMAETLARETQNDSIQLNATPSYQDVWTDPSLAGRTPDLSEQLDYTDVLVTPDNGTINYSEHIQPIWERERGVFGSDTCTFCHYSGNVRTDINGSAGLDLTSTPNATGQPTSYQSLLLGTPLLNEQFPQAIQGSDGKGLILRKAPLVTAGLSRSSILTEVLYHTEIKAIHYSLDDHLMNHQGLLSNGELRIINEWIDLGAQFSNSPYEPNAANDVSGGYLLDLSEIQRQSVSDTQLNQAKADFSDVIHPMLMEECGYCHRPQAADDSPTDMTTSIDLTVITQAELPGNRLILTGNTESDFNAVFSMIDDFSSPSNSTLLSKPASVNNNPLLHPYKSVELDPQTGLPLSASAYLPTDSINYQLLRIWINGF
ncbi:MAG: hypothetical protein KUG82_04435 [Pseudomonadales bacterium]|nr:hypothetical protein [Pseudomonadales bacterium]